MCRHFAYLGLPVTLAELMLDPPHSLAVQSYAPSDMRGGGTVNADGFGAGWFAAGAGPRPDSGPAENSSARAAGESAQPSPAAPAEARRYRRAAPIWQDAGFAELARATVASGVLGAVRNATAGMPVAEAACAPFTDGQWLFSLNGAIAGWPDSAVWLVDGVPRRELLSMQVLTDASLLWAVLHQRLAASEDPASALGSLVTEVLAAAPGSRLTTLLTDGRHIYGTTVTHSLWWRHSAEAVLVASEPFDDSPGWQPLPDGQLVTADRSGVRHRPLPLPARDEAESESHVHQRR
ncbi:MAG TPA: ergothioneine biosynthesis protein EgtC [Jatrophihabitans sp.]|jgi:glutamine amidotransferase|uniref:ergothioneine biosynthesis protein EgtC n=1 Tax=Jatrophihabitans sp. TaxID=1932789 RepID=UPI002F1C5FC3